MKAVCVGEAGVLNVCEVPKPQPKPDEALVRILSSGLNRADVLQRKGLYPPPQDAPANIPGLEFAGIVEAIGPRASRVVAGQRVFGLSSGGAHAEFIASPHDLLMQIPDAIADVEAGAIPEAYITAHDALVTQAVLQTGERVLIHAIGSGVGLAALQIAKDKGCEVFGTSRSADKRKRVEMMGADRVCAPEAFDTEVLEATGGGGVDVILDPVGGAYFERNLQALGQRGRLVIIATMSGTSAQLSIPVLMRKRLRVIGTVLRSRSVSEKAAATRAFERDLLAKLAGGAMKVVVDRILPIEEAADAYNYMEENRNLGKIVLTTWSG